MTEIDKKTRYDDKDIEIIYGHCDRCGIYRTIGIITPKNALIYKDWKPRLCSACLEEIGRFVRGHE